MRKSVIVLSFVIFVSIFLISSASALFIGITDGYITNMSGHYVEGATVVATVSGCSGGAANGCTGSDTTDANGYYIVNNLNLPKSGTSNITATKDSGSGSDGGVADDTQIAHINATICYSPSSPSLSALGDSHNTTVIFSWTSGTDPKGYSTTDDFDLDGNTTSPATSPITEVGMDFGEHTWQVRTCNSQCCGSWASDSFNLTNSAPSVPTDLGVDVGSSTTSLNWTSGTDSDGDATYDEFRYDENGTIVTPATSPYEVQNALLIEWSVRTCDSYGECSSWVSNQSVNCVNFSSSDCPEVEECETVTTVASGGGSTGTGSYISKWKYREAEIYCNGIRIDNQTLLRIELLMRGGINKISMYGVNWTVESLQHCPWCYDGEKNYDERGVDCGGSCRECTEAEIPAGITGYIHPILWALFIIIAIRIFYQIYKKRVLKRIAERVRYRGVF